MKLQFEPDLGPREGGLATLVHTNKPALLPQEKKMTLRKARAVETWGWPNPAGGTRWTS